MVSYIQSQRTLEWWTDNPVCMLSATHSLHLLLILRLTHKPKDWHREGYVEEQAGVVAQW